jgi:hypothetical protein
MKKKIIQEDSCTLCQSAPETSPHILRDCPRVLPLWQNIGIPTLLDSFFSPNISYWMQSCSNSSLSTSLHSKLLFKDIFPILCWSIWTARNKTAFEGTEFNQSAIAQQLSSLAIELKFSLPQKIDKPPKETVLIGWKPPPPGFLKLNTDGSALGNPRPANAGGLIRDNNGKWIKGFSRVIGTTNSFAAELWGLRDGLELARKLDITKLIVEVDAKAVVDIILTDNIQILDTHPYSALIHDCRYMIQSFEEAILQHIHREGNFCAYLLSKARCISEPVFSKFTSPPSFVVSQLLADIWGVSYPRIL